MSENILRGSLTSTQTSKGALGFKGERGYSNYEIYVKNGGTLTEEQWLEHFGVDLTGYVKTTELLDLIYPVGAIYISATNVNPSTILGGTWEQIQDKFLLACGSTYANGSTGGEATHTLTVSEIPSHRHERARDLLNNQLLGEAGGTITNVAGLTYNTGKYAYTDTAHNNVVTDYTGGGQAHNNMPPYLAVYVWKRTE